MSNTNRIKNKIGYWVISAGFIGSFPAFGGENCAKITLSPADVCSELKATADLSGCADEVVGEAVVRCRKSGAAVRINGRKAKYSAVIKKIEGAWGADGWEVSDIVRHDLAKVALQKSANVKEVERAPAGNVPMPHTQPSPLPTAIPTATTPNTTFSGYFDAYLAHNFNRPAIKTPTPGASLAAPQNALRYYDWNSDQLSLNLIELSIKHQRKETTLLIDLDFGQQADMNAQAATLSSNGGLTPGLADELSKHIGQAILTYNPSAVPGLIIEAGKMYTHIGLEVPKAKDNWNYSRSSIFSFGLPFWHTGLHAGYSVVPERVSVSAYLYEGWNTIYPANTTPTYGAQLKWTPNDRVVFAYNYLGGPEQAGNNSNLRQVHESNLTVTLSPELSVAADAMIGTESAVTLLSGSTVDATWGGLQLGAKWQVTPKWSLAPRIEIYRDSQGYTLGGEAQTLEGYTITPSYQLSDGLEARFEFRYDHSSDAARFNAFSGPSSGQTTVLLGLLFAF